MKGLKTVFILFVRTMKILMNPVSFIYIKLFQKKKLHVIILNREKRIMNQILISEKIYVTPELKKKKKF